MVFSAGIAFAVALAAHLGAGAHECGVTDLTWFVLASEQRHSEEILG